MPELNKGEIQFSFIESTGQWLVRLRGGEIVLSQPRNREEAQNLIDLLEAYLRITKRNLT